MEQVLNLISQHQLTSFLDIGANYGRFSVALKNFYQDMDILMLEANPFCDAFLKRTGISYELVCLSDSEKEVKFYFQDNDFTGTGASYYLEKTQWYSNKNFTKMQTRRLDDVVTKTYDFIKLDTQGSELDIMKGGKKTIGAARFVLIETSLIEYNESAPLKQEIFEYMQNIGFKPLEMVEEHYMGESVIQEDWIFQNA
jgi:FkbM family methyltransferase